MKKVLILGASGMLGDMVASVFSKEKNIEVILTGRTADAVARIQSSYPMCTVEILDAHQEILSFAKRHKNVSYIVNCIGIIKPFIHDDIPAEVENALVVNALFPIRLAKAFPNAHIIQIATDCVYTGTLGLYTETNLHDATDVYGKTKSLGETHIPNVHHLRCSIIGPEAGTSKSLLEWFRNREQGETIHGFTNHNWNGIPTLHFAKICLGVVRDDVELAHMQHVVPNDTVNKYQLLTYFQKAYERADLVIIDSLATSAVDRTLHTATPAMNKKLWRAAGYSSIPTIQQMIEELALYSK